jgi:hypothetical protein
MHDPEITNNASPECHDLPGTPREFAALIRNLVDAEDGEGREDEFNALAEKYEAILNDAMDSGSYLLAVETIKILERLLYMKAGGDSWDAREIGFLCSFASEHECAQEPAKYRKKAIEYLLVSTLDLRDDEDVIYYLAENILNHIESCDKITADDECYVQELREIVLDFFAGDPDNFCANKAMTEFKLAEAIILAKKKEGGVDTCIRIAERSAVEAVSIALFKDGELGDEIRGFQRKYGFVTDSILAMTQIRQPVSSPESPQAVSL